MITNHSERGGFAQVHDITQSQIYASVSSIARPKLGYEE